MKPDIIRAPYKQYIVIKHGQRERKPFTRHLVPHLVTIPLFGKSEPSHFPLFYALEMIDTERLNEDRRNTRYLVGY